MLAFSDLIRAFFIILGVATLVGFLLSLRKGAKIRAIAREARKQNEPRNWLFVNAYGSQQAQAGVAMTYREALEFLKNHIGCSFVQADHDNAIIFFDGRRLGG